MKKLATIKAFLHDGWKLASPFWKSKERKKAGLLFALAMACNIANIYMAVRLANWSRDFFNAMDKRDIDAFFYQLGMLFVLSTMSLLLYANQRYFCGKGILLWRRWLSEYYTSRWLRTKCYYEETFFHRIDNPDQRIAEDLRIFPTRTVGMIFDFVDSVGSLGAFSVILWNLSSSYPFFGITIPGIMFWLAVGFVIIGTWAVHRIGKPLIELERRTQRTEANYRYRLIKIREKAKEIAIYGSEEPERQAVGERFQDVFAVWLKTILKERQLNYFMSGYSHISGVVPFLIAAPKYFSGAFGMGELMQTVQAFNSVRVSLSWFILNYPSLTEWKATVDRLTQFDRLLRMEHALRGPKVEVQPENSWKLQDLQLRTPDGSALGRPVSQLWQSGRRIAITGPSGIGKSTLVQALRGIWLFGEGNVFSPAGKKLFFAQTPYLPEGSICSLLSYPSADVVNEEDAKRILTKLELDQWIPNLHEVRKWDMIFSPGEQQRLVLGRIWYSKPDWVIFDEALSAVDPACRNRIYQRLKDDFPSMAVIGVEHHLPETDFYDEIIDWGELK